MKILHVLTTPRAEGTPRLVLDWLAVEGYEQRVLFLESTPNDLLHLFPQDTIYVNQSLVKGYKKIKQIKRLVAQTCEKEQPDLVISWSTGLSQWVLWGAKSAGVTQLIAHCGNAPGDSFVGKYLYSYMSFWINGFLGSKVICCSEYIKKQYCAIPAIPDSIFYAVYNCVSTARFNKKEVVGDTVASKVIMVATLEQHKDHVTLLDAWQKVETENPAAELLIVGKGRLDGMLKQYAESLGLKSVKFLGSRNDVPLLLSQSDVFVFSTTPNEGFGTVLIEALSVGLPIVATDVPACREVLRDGEFGVLIPAKNSESLAKAILAALQQKETSNAVERRYQYATSFTPQNMISKYVEIAK